MWLEKCLLILQFWVLSAKNLPLKIFRPPCSLIHFGSVCKSVKFYFSNIAQPRKICPLKYLGYTAYAFTQYKLFVMNDELSVYTSFRVTSSKETKDGHMSMRDLTDMYALNPQDAY